MKRGDSLGTGLARADEGAAVLNGWLKRYPSEPLKHEVRSEFDNMSDARQKAALRVVNSGGANYGGPYTELQALLKPAAPLPKPTLIERFVTSVLLGRREF